MVFLFLHVFVHALHTHHHTFLFAVEHQRLLVQVAFHLLKTIGSAAVVSYTLGIVTGLTASALFGFGGFAFVVDVASALGVGHHFEFGFAEFALTLIDGLFEFVFA